MHPPRSYPLVNTGVCQGVGCGAFCVGDICASQCKGDGCGDGCTGEMCAFRCEDSAGNVGPNADNPAAQCGCGANGAVNTCTHRWDTCIVLPKKGKSAKSMKSHSHSHSHTAKGPKGKAAGLKAKQSQSARIEVGAGVALVGMVGVVALVATKVRASVAPEAGAPYLLAGTPTAPTEPLAAAAESSPCMV